jgi:VanZ family protein
LTGKPKKDILESHMKNTGKIFIRLPAFFIMAVSFYLSSRSTLPGIPLFPHADKIVHFVCFGALSAAWAFWFSLETWKNRKWRCALLCVLFTSLYGFLDEFHQSFVPGRSADILDWIADTAGAFPGSLIGLGLLRRITRS